MGPGGVAAGDGEEFGQELRAEVVAEDPPGRGAGGRVGGRPVVERGQRGGQQGEAVVLAVDALDGAVVQLVRPEGELAVDDRVLAQRGTAGLPAGLHLGGGRAVVVGGVAGGEPRQEVLLEAPLEAHRLAQLEPLPGAVETDVAVQHHPLDPVREERRVVGADHRGVGRPVVADPALAEEGAQQVDVPGGLFGGQEGQQAAAALLAAGGEGGRVGDHAGAVGRRVVAEVPGEEGAELLGGLADGPGAAADAALVETDDVVGGAEGGCVAHMVGRAEQPLAAGAARGRDQGADPPGRIGRAVPGDRDGDVRSAARMVPVPGRGHGGALQRGLLRAGLPGELLVGVAGGGGRRGGRRDGTGGAGRGGEGEEGEQCGGAPTGRGAAESAVAAGGGAGGEGAGGGGAGGTDLVSCGHGTILTVRSIVVDRARTRLCGGACTTPTRLPGTAEHPPG